MDATTIHVGELGALEAYNEHAAPVQLKTLWANRTAVLVFVRHFG